MRHERQSDGTLDPGSVFVVVKNGKNDGASVTNSDVAGVAVKGYLDAVATSVAGMRLEELAL